MQEKNIDISSPEFQNALHLIMHTQQSLFLTGKAGTGKSTFLRYVCQQTKKKHVILAPTGIAAINAGGCTIHSFFKLPFHPLVPDDPRYAGRKLRDFLRYNKEQIKLLRELELIVIDEISMVRADIIDFIDRILRTFTGNWRQAFGGKQMLLIGDIFQLEPVVKGDERDILNRFYPNAYFFSARVFRQTELVSIELKKVFRQKDMAFIRALDHIRTGKISALEMQLLNMRVRTEEERQREREENPDGADLDIVLATRRDNVDYINRHNLDRLPGAPVVFRGKTTGEFPESSLPTLMELELKCGAQVIFVKNDRDHQFVNGTLGIVEYIDEQEGEVGVITDDGKSILVKPDVWENVRYTYNEEEKKIEEEVLGSFTQFPLRLAWAITIHKSQGLTFKKATIDLSGGTFAGGQAYVALSRCTSLDGMTLCQPLSPADVFVKDEIVRFANTFNDKGTLDRALRLAQADIEYAACARDFELGDMNSCLNHFFTAIHARYDIEKPAPKRLLRRKLNVINSLREENRTLREKMQEEVRAMQKKIQEQNKRLETYAKEYLAMGDACITEAHNDKAALANYNKAIDLCPTLMDAWVRKGVTLMDGGNLQDALSCLKHAARRSPMLFKARYNLGRVLLELGKYEEAINEFSHATSIRPEHAKSHELLGDCFARLGDEEKADIYWGIAEQLRKRKGKSR